LCWFDIRRCLEENEDNDGCNAADGQVDPEALEVVSS
jgi:hypothetical protein